MDKFEKLEAEYPQLKIKITSLPPGQGGFIYNDHVFIDKNRDRPAQNCILAEEIGHYETTVGNIVNQDNTDKRKQELKARKWGYYKLITLDGLIECFKKSISNLDDLAEFFEVIPKYLLEAFKYLEEKYGQVFKYHGYLFGFSHGLNIFEESASFKNRPDIIC